MKLYVVLGMTLLLLAACGSQSGGPKGDVVVVTSSEQPVEQQREVFIPRPKPVEKPKEPMLQVDFLKAGHGDATLIRTPEGKRIMINCGALGASGDVLAFFARENISAIDALLTTNGRAESVGGCGAVRSALRIGKVLDSALADITQQRSNAAELDKRGFMLEDGRIWLKLNSAVRIELMVPYDADRAKRVDDHTLVPEISYGQHRVLLLNNCGLGCQRELAGADLRADVLQLAQHAREEANGDKLLDMVQPSIAIASVGFGNTERLPKRDLILKLNQRRIKLYRTDVQYTVSLTSNGRTLTVESEVPYRLERIG